MSPLLFPWCAFSRWPAGRGPRFVDRELMHNMLPTQRLSYHVQVPYPSLGTEVLVPLLLTLNGDDLRTLWGARAPSPPPALTLEGGVGGSPLAQPPSAAESQDTCPVPGVLHDVMCILRQHGARILPCLRPDGGAVLGSGALGTTAGPAAAAVPQPTYHGDLISARFSLRPDGEEGRYTVLTHAAGRGGVLLRPQAVAPFTLLVSVADKVADVARRQRVAAAGGAAGGAG